MHLLLGYSGNSPQSSVGKELSPIPRMHSLNWPMKHSPTIVKAGLKCLIQTAQSVHIQTMTGCSLVCSVGFILAVRP